MDRSTFSSILAAVARRWWLALLVFAAVMVADVYYTLTRQPTYLARTTLVIGPSSNIDRSQLVYSVDAIGRGRIVGTYVEVLGSEVIQRAALEQLGYSTELLNRFIVFRSSALAESAVIQVTAESPDPEFSAETLNLVADLGVTRLAELYPVYSLTVLTGATPPTLPYRPDPIRNYSLGVALGLVLAVVLAYLFDLGLVYRQRGAAAAESRRGPAFRGRAGESGSALRGKTDPSGASA